MSRLFRTIPHELVEEYYAQGWVFAGPLRGSHGLYRCLMELPS
jgi:hypothetical protein